MVVFLGINTVMTPPAVSIPNDNGVTSKRSKSLTLESADSDVNIAACTAAPIIIRKKLPYATASSGLILRFACLPPKKSSNNYTILGIRVEPTFNGKTTSD